MQAVRKIVIVGAGRVGSGIVQTVPGTWGVTVVDLDEHRLAAVVPARAIERVCGDASSRLVLARCGLGPTSTLVLTTRDDAVNVEAARIARRDFEVHDIVVVLSDVDGADLEADIDIVERADAVVAQLRARIGGLRGGAPAGAGRGELMQVPVLAGSPAIGRLLRDLHRGDWLVAMLYRGETLVVPRGDTTIQEGDRVLLAGEPTDLDTVAMFFAADNLRSRRRGAPVSGSPIRRRERRRGGSPRARRPRPLSNSRRRCSIRRSRPAPRSRIGCAPRTSDALSSRLDRSPGSPGSG